MPLIIYSVNVKSTDLVLNTCRNPKDWPQWKLCCFLCIM